MNFIQTLALSALLITLGCQAQKSENVTLIDKTIYEQMLDEMELVQLVDVRTPEEYADGAIDGATNINFFDGDFVAQCEKEFDKVQPLVIYCAAGGRSAKAAAKLEAAGFKALYDVEGGYGNWE